MRFQFTSGAVLSKLTINIPAGMYEPTITISAWRRDGEPTKFGGVEHLDPADFGGAIDRARQIALQEGETRFDEMTPEERKSLETVRGELALMSAAAPQVA